MSSPRRPRFRLIESALSAICCSSRSTKWGTTSVPFEETGLADVGDAAVDDDARIEHLVRFSGAPVAEDPAEGGKVEVLALAGPGQQADVGHQHQDHDLDECHGVGLKPHPADDDADQAGTDNAQNRAQGRADQCLKRTPPDPQLHQHDQACQAGADDESVRDVEVEWANGITTDENCDEQ